MHLCFIVGAAAAFLAPRTRRAPPHGWRASRTTALRAQDFDGDAYEVLGVSKDATKTELRKAFRKKAMKTHRTV